MNIAVYLGSSMGDDPKYSELTQSIGQWICKHQNTLVYGAGSKGQMGCWRIRSIREKAESSV